MAAVFAKRGSKDDVNAFARQLSAKADSSRLHPSTAAVEWLRVTTGSSGSQHTSPGQLVMLTSVPITRPAVHAGSLDAANPSEGPLVSLWRAKGFHYDDDAAEKITQAVIAFNNGKQYCYPADQVRAVMCFLMLM